MLSLNSTTIGTVSGQPPALGNVALTVGRPSLASPPTGTTCTLVVVVLPLLPPPLGLAFGLKARTTLSQPASSSAPADAASNTARRKGSLDMAARRLPDGTPPALVPGVCANRPCQRPCRPGPAPP